MHSASSASAAAQSAVSDRAVPGWAIGAARATAQSTVSGNAAHCCPCAATQPAIRERAVPAIARAAALSAIVPALTTSRARKGRGAAQTEPISGAETPVTPRHRPAEVFLVSTRPRLDDVHRFFYIIGHRAHRIAEHPHRPPPVPRRDGRRCDDDPSLRPVPRWRGGEPWYRAARRDREADGFSTSYRSTGAGQSRCSPKRDYRPGDRRRARVIARRPDFVPLKLRMVSDDRILRSPGRRDQAGQAGFRKRCADGAIRFAGRGNLESGSIADPTANLDCGELENVGQPGQAELSTADVMRRRILASGPP